MLWCSDMQRQAVGEKTRVDPFQLREREGSGGRMIDTSSAAESTSLIRRRIGGMDESKERLGERESWQI